MTKLCDWVRYISPWGVALHIPEGEESNASEGEMSKGLEIQKN